MSNMAFGYVSTHNGCMHGSNGEKKCKHPLVQNAHPLQAHEPFQVEFCT